MSRLSPVNSNVASVEQAALFHRIESAYGWVPNFLRVFAHSPVALRAFYGADVIAQQGILNARTRVRIALCIAQHSRCDYGLAAYTAAARELGLVTAETETNRAGTSQDAKAAAAVTLALKLAQMRGDITDRDIETVRKAGYSDAEIVEIILHVGLNLLSCTLSNASAMAIDFP